MLLVLSKILSSLNWQIIDKELKKKHFSFVNKDTSTEVLPSVMKQAWSAHDNCYLFHCYPGLCGPMWHREPLTLVIKRVDTAGCLPAIMPF